MWIYYAYLYDPLYVLKLHEDQNGYHDTVMMNI